MGTTDQAGSDLALDGIDLLDIGVGLFDADRRLLRCNPAFLALRNYPETLCHPGVSLEALLRHNALHGDFGEGDPDRLVAGRLAEIAATEDRTVERETGDGRIISIRYQKTGSGGLMVTYRDRTEERRAEAALRQSEERYALISEAAEEAIYEWDIAANRFYASDRLKALIGRDWGEQGARAWNWDDIVHPDDQDTYGAELKRHLSGAALRWECTYRLQDAGGGWRWVSDHGTSVRDETGAALRMVAAIRDISDQVDREAALTDSENRLRLVTDAASDGIYDWDVSADILYISDRLAGLVKIDLGSSSSAAWLDAIHPEDQQRYVDGVRRHFKGETPAMEGDYRIRSTAGGYIWVHDRALGHRDAAGRVTRYVGAVTDVTEIREVRSQVEASRARLNSALAALSDGILLIDGENRVEMFNRRYVELFSAACGVDMTDVIGEGRDFFDMIREGYDLGMFVPHPGGVEAWLADRRKAFRNLAHQLEMPLANGMWLLRNERPMPGGGRIAVYTDVTEFKQREVEANAARQRFEDAIEAIASGFALWDAEDRLVVSNLRYREYFHGLADMAVPGAAFSDLIRAAIARGLFPNAGDDAEAFLAKVLAIRREVGGGAREQVIGGVWLQVTDHRTADGGIVSIYTDITELKRRQAQIARQAEILELTLENMGQGITLVDGDLKTIALNRKFLELMELPEHLFERGFTMEEAFRYNAERGEYGPGDIEEQVRQRLELAAQFLPHKFERTRPDGRIIEIAGNPIEGGGMVATYTDVTERRRTEKALQDSFDELRIVLDNIDYGVILLDPDLRVRLVNKVQGDIWGFTEELIAGRPSMRDLLEFNRTSGRYAVPADDWDDWAEKRVAQVRQGDIAPTEIARPDGIVLRYSCVALPDGGRMLTYFDITELKRRETESVEARSRAEAALAELQKAQQRLVQAEKMASLGQLTAGIAHEIKNPLNFVNNFSKLSIDLLGELSELIEGPIAALGEDDKEDAEELFGMISGNLDKISHHGARADSIVKNMLLHSREGPSVLQTVSVNAIAEEALNLAYHGARAENPTFNIEMDTDLDDAAGEIACYPQDLMRVILNLVTNGMYAANKRLEAGVDGFVPTIRLATRRAGEAVDITVRDNGTGIPEAVREKIFLPFFTTKPAGEGTGLGLSLSYDIVVKQHGGALTVESQAGEFTEFRVHLPITGGTT